MTLFGLLPDKSLNLKETAPKQEILNGPYTLSKDPAATRDPLLDTAILAQTAASTRWLALSKKKITNGAYSFLIGYLPLNLLFCSNNHSLPLSHKKTMGSGSYSVSLSNHLAIFEAEVCFLYIKSGEVRVKFPATFKLKIRQAALLNNREQGATGVIP